MSEEPYVVTERGDPRDRVANQRDTPQPQHRADGAATFDALRQALSEAKQTFAPESWAKYECPVIVDGKTLEAALAGVDDLDRWVRLISQPEAGDSPELTHRKALVRDKIPVGEQAAATAPTDASLSSSAPAGMTPQHRADTLAETVREGLDWVEYRCPVSVSKDAYAALSELVSLAHAGATNTLPRDTDEKPSDAMPSAGMSDWREEAEWWKRTCEYWHDRAERAEAETERLRELAKRAKSQAAAPDYDEEAIRAALWGVVDAALAGGQADKDDHGVAGVKPWRVWGGQADKEPTT